MTATALSRLTLTDFRSYARADLVLDGRLLGGEAVPQPLPTEPFTTTSTISWFAHSFASIGEAQYQTPRPSNFSRFSTCGRR